MESLKEIRQRLVWAEDQIRNFIAKAGGSPDADPPSDSALYHLQTARSGLTQHIGEPEPPPEEPEEPVEDPPEDPIEEPIEDPIDDPGGAPAFVEDFTSYRDTAEFLADPRNIYHAGAHADRSHMAIDPSVGLDVDGHDLPQSLRYTYPARPGACGGYRISRSIRWNRPGVTGIAPGRHIWTEVYARFPADYATTVPNSWGCTSANSQKLFFQTIDNQCPTCPAGRFDIRVGCQGGNALCVGVPNGSCVPSWGGGKDRCGNFPVFDGQWHSYRMEARIPTTPDSGPGACDGSGDGIMRLWVDGTLMAEATDVHTAATQLIGVVFGSNINHGPAAEQSYWWGRLAAWETDPGW